ncbi:phage tail spike protein [Enterococcus sp. N249-2]
MKPRIYEPTEKDFSHNGLGIMIDTTRCDVTEQANGKYEIEIEHPLTSRFSNYFENGYQIKAKPNDQEEYHVFEIKNTYKDTISNTILIYGQSRTYKIGNREVRHVAIDSKNGAEAMAAIENGMDEPSDVKLFSDITTKSSTVFEARNVLSCIAGDQGSMMQYWGGEIKREPFKLSLLRRRGRDNVGTVRYGKDLVGLKVKFDWSSIVTKVLPYADLQNSEDGTTNRIYGNAVLSDLATNYPDVYAKHIQFTEEQGVKDLASLNRIAANYFKSINAGSDKPKISIELEIEKLTDSEEAKEFAKIRNYGLFDTFSVYHKLYDIHIDTKINSVVYDSLTEKNKKINCGDAQMAFYTKQNYELQETIKTLAKKGYMSEFVDYVTNLINGVEGGSVLQYPKNKPHTTYYMDSDSRDTAKDVIAINNQGLGFSRTGWQGPFTNAWSIAGDLNADFIRAGILSGILVQGVALKTMDDKDFQVVMAGGNFAFEKQVVSTGLEDVHGERLGGITATYGETGINGFAIVQEPGYIFSINNGAENGSSLPLFQVPADSTPDNQKYIIYGNGIFSAGSVTFRDAVTMDGRLDVKELYVNGVKIDQNGGGSGGNGGGWNGQYPPEVTSDRDKRYWQIWAMFIGAGGTQQAAAALLGNAQGESDANPTADEGNGAAGFGYGVWQWTDGTGATSGRVYMINLMTRAGISGDPDTITTQFKLLMWHAPNGQWIATSAYPYTWSQFMNMTDIAVATRSFEENFERPLNDHPERITWANEWYLKFKDLDIPQSSGYIVPIDTPVTVTSEFGWRTHPITGESNYHNGIDLVNNNSNAPIYASADGEVIVAGDANYFDWYGNWVVIKHSDGMYTGYAHLSSVNVSKGSTVTQGQQIGVIGTTGPSTGIHLHFQFFDEMYPSSNDHFFNPRDYIDF